jgi:hypothetical protein
VRRVRAWQFPTDLYGRDLILIKGHYKDVEEFFSKAKTNMEWTQARGRYFRITKNGFRSDFVVIVTGMKTKWTESEILSHELAHFCIATLEYVGLKINDEQSEAFTYYHDWWVKRCRAVLRTY